MTQDEIFVYQGRKEASKQVRKERLNEAQKEEITWITPGKMYIQCNDCRLWQIGKLYRFIKKKQSLLIIYSMYT